MKNNQVAIYQIEETFKITGRGIVFAGHILEGIVSLGDYIEFSILGKRIKRKITGVEGVNSVQSSKINIGLLIKCVDGREIEELWNWEPRNTIAIVSKTKD